MIVLLAMISIDWERFPSYLFTISFVLTVIGFLVLILFPRQSWANFWMSGIILPSLLGSVYSVVLLVSFCAPYPRQLQSLTCAEARNIARGNSNYVCDESSLHVSNPLDFLSLAGVRRLFLKDGLLVAAFIDILLLELAVAAWMSRKATQLRMPRRYLLTCIILTLGAPGTGVVLFTMLAGQEGLKEIARTGTGATSARPVLARPLDRSESSR